MCVLLGWDAGGNNVLFAPLLLVVKSAVDVDAAFASAVHTERLTNSQVARTPHVISMTL